MYIKTAFISLALLLFASESGRSAIIPVGSGSYTTTFPGVNQENRNGCPGGSPHIFYQVIFFLKSGVSVVRYLLGGTYG